MLAKLQLAVKYILITAASLLMLGLFDSNPAWKVLIYALFALGLNKTIDHLYKGPVAPLIQGVSATLLAYVLSLTPFLRATFATLIGFAILFSVAELFYRKFVKKSN
ncbi:MAG: hypothetical protein QM401_00035 [Bacillota bacterium]|nr:hypothetical protein [Bacillota bacterium]